MKKLNIILAGGLLTIIIPGCTVTVEEAKYQVIEKENNFELRDYAPQIIAETVIDGSLENAGNKAFNILYAYISGKNKAKNKISMTAPVSQEAASETIEMSAPVSQKKASTGWVVSFTMPAEYTMETIPEPTDSRVKLRLIPERKVAAVRYSGSWSRKLYENNLELLNSWIEQKGLTPNGDPIWARYNPPFTLWFLRRNEILIPLSDSKK